MAAGAQYTLLGAGGFGAVFTPAFPDDPPFEGDSSDFVTKLFFRDRDYKKAIENNAPRLARNVPSLHIPYQAYTRKYVGGDLPESLRKEIEEYLQQQKGDPSCCTISLDSPIHMIRMPKLGTALDLIDEDTYESIPLEVRLREIYKVMNVVKAIGDSGYIHRDIRVPNVLINPTSGTMTIIDFDLLMPMAESHAGRPKPWYNIPPEALILQTYDIKYKRDKNIVTETIQPKSFIKQMLKSFARTQSRTSIREMSYKYIKDLLNISDVYRGGRLVSSEFHSNISNEIRDWIGDISDYIADTIIRPAIQIFHAGLVAAKGDAEEVKQIKDSLMHDYKTTIYEKGFAYFDKIRKDKFIKTIDSFGLAMCLRRIAHSFNYGSYDESNKLYAYMANMLCPRMMHGNPEARIDIETAMREFKTFAHETFGVDLDPPTKSAAAEVVAEEAERLAALAGGAAAAPAPQKDAIPQLAEAAQAAANAQPSPKKGGMLNRIRGVFRGCTSKACMKGVASPTRRAPSKGGRRRRKVRRSAKR